MADYFTHFSCMFDVLTPENVVRALEIYRTLSDEIDRDGDTIGFRASVQPED